MALFIIEFASTFLLITSLLLLLAVLLKHFKGMQAPAYWVYYLGAFALLAISNAYANLFQGSLVSLDVSLRFVANLSILLGSYEIFKRYESRVSAKITSVRKTKKRRARKH